MTHLLIVIPHADARPIFWAEGELDADLDWVAEQVGGRLEIIPRWDSYMGYPTVAYMQEHAHLKGLPSNARATALWWRALGGTHEKDPVLCGDVVVCANIGQT